ncbi:MAG: hypothetical protein ACTSU5_20530 [Promethearchaeota archaeon]
MKEGSSRDVAAVAFSVLFGTTFPVVGQFQFLVYRGSPGDYAVIAAGLLVVPLALLRRLDRLDRHPFWLATALGACAALAAVLSLLASIVVPNRLVGRYPEVTVGGATFSRHVFLVVPWLASCSTGMACAVLLAYQRGSVGSGGTGAWFAAWSSAGSAAVGGVMAHLSARLGWVAFAPLASFLLAATAAWSFHLVSSRVKAEDDAGSPTPTTLGSGGDGGFHAPGGFAQSTPQAHRAQPAPPSSPGPLSPLALVGDLLVLSGVVLLNQAFSTRKQALVSLFPFSLVAGVAGLAGTALVIVASRLNASSSQSRHGPPGSPRVLSLGRWSRNPGLLAVPLAILALTFAPLSKVAYSHPPAYWILLGVAFFLALWSTTLRAFHLASSRGRVGRLAGTLAVLALPFLLSQLISQGHSYDAGNAADLLVLVAVLFSAGAALVLAGVLTGDRWAGTSRPPGAVDGGSRPPAAKRRVTGMGSPAVVLALLVASFTAMLAAGLALDASSAGATSSSTHLAFPGTLPEGGVHVGEPFGICHGSDGTGGLEAEYNVQWNRKDLPWNFVERAPGSFVFNGRTVEDEFHEAPAGGGLELNLTMDILGNDGATLADLDPAGAGYYGVFLDNDTSHVGENLFGQVVDNSSSTIRLTKPPPGGRSLLVTYNQTTPFPWGDLAGGLDEYVENLNASGVKYLPILDYGNAIYGSAYSNYLNSSVLGEWRRFVTRAVERYAPFVDYWEVWNEPNNVFGHRIGTWRDFFDVLEAAADCIEASDPTAKVLVGGLGGTDEMEFLESIFANVMEADGYYDNFDGICFHPYSTKNPEDLLQHIEDYNRVCAGHGWTWDAGKVILCTEFGFPTNGTGHSGLVDPFREQADQVVKGMAIGAGVFDVFIWYCESDAPYGAWWDLDQRLDSEMYFGLFLGDASTPKPAAHAFNLTSRLLSDSVLQPDRLAFDLSPGVSAGDVFAYDYRKPDGAETVVLWNVLFTELEYRLSFPGRLDPSSAPIVYDIYTGTPRPAAWEYDPASNGTTVTLAGGYSPAVVTFKPASNPGRVTLRVVGNWFTAMQSVVLPAACGAISLVSLASIAWGGGTPPRRTGAT